MASSNPLYSQISAPFKTEIALRLDHGETVGVRVYIVAFSVDEITYKPSKLKFLSGLGYAIYIAAFELAEEEEYVGDLAMKGKFEAKELDVKEQFVPRPIHTPYSSSNNLAMMNSHGSQTSLLLAPSPLSRAVLPPLIEQSPSPDTEANTNLPSRKASISAQTPTKFESVSSDATISVPLIAPLAKPASQSLKDFNNAGTSTGDNILKHHPAISSEAAMSSSTKVSVIGLPSSLVCGTSNHSDLGSSMSLAPPTWEPVDTFSFPIAKISVKCFVPDNLTFNSFEDMKHIADGSNSNIFLGKFLGAKVVVKIIKEEVQNNPVAIHEFDIEHGMLSR